MQLSPQLLQNHSVYPASAPVGSTGGAAYNRAGSDGGRPCRTEPHFFFFFVNYLGHLTPWVRTNATEALASVGARTTQAEGSSPARMHARAREEERREVRCDSGVFFFFG